MIIAVYNTTGIIYTSDSSSLDYNKEDDYRAGVTLKAVF